MSVMPLVRNRLPWFVAGWLTLQLVALCVAPVALRASFISGISGISVGERTCSCPGAEPGQQCPMHRQHGDGHHEERGRCAMRGTLGQSQAVLLVLAAPGVVPQNRYVPHVPQQVARLVFGQTVTVSRSELPEFPPPRT